VGEKLPKLLNRPMTLATVCYFTINSKPCITMCHCPLFSNTDFPWPRNENPWPIGTTDISVYDNWSVSKPVQTVNNITLWFIICVTSTELLSAVVKITWHYHHFPWLSMTFAIFHDFPGLENGLPKLRDHGTLLSAFTSHSKHKTLTQICAELSHVSANTFTGTNWH